MNEELIECPDCRHKVSPRAEWCPGCGSKLKDTYTERLAKRQERLAKRQMVATKVAVTAFLLFIGGCVAMSMLSGG